MELNNDDDGYSYFVWNHQYNMRSKLLEIGEKPIIEETTQLLKDIVNGTRLHSGWHSRYYLAGNLTRSCDLVDCDDNTVTMRIPRSIDTELLVSIFKLYRVFSNQNEGSKIRTDPNFPSIEGAVEALKEMERMHIKSIKKAVFRPNQWGSRAIGLWLWDYVQIYSGTTISAIRAIRLQLGPEVKRLGFEDSEENVYRRFFRKTAECIDACEVLPFK